MKEKYKAVEILFIISPLIQSEKKKDVNLADATIKEQLTSLKDSSNEVLKLCLKESEANAEHCQKLIKDYGRLPYRNYILGRKNTDAEEKFLKNIDE